MVMGSFLGTMLEEGCSVMIGGRGSEQEGLVISTKLGNRERGVVICSSHWEIAAFWETLLFRFREREMFLGIRMFYRR